MGVCLGLGLTTSTLIIPIAHRQKPVLQALKISTELRLEKVIFEGDANNVLLAIKGVHEFEDWRATQLLTQCKQLLFCKSFWFLSFTPRVYNYVAHNQFSFFLFTNYRK